MSDDAPQTVFAKIVSGEIPCRRVYENEHVLAFLDVSPLAAGHVLLIPKEPHASLEDLPERLAAALGSALPRLVRAVRVATGATGVNVLQNNGQVAGQEVMHVHFHIIPRTEGDGLGFRWNPTEYAPGQADSIQNVIVDALAETE